MSQEIDRTNNEVKYPLDLTCERRNCEMEAAE